MRIRLDLRHQPDAVLLGLQAIAPNLTAEVGLLTGDRVGARVDARTEAAPERLDRPLTHAEDGKSRVRHMPRSMPGSSGANAAKPQAHADDLGFLGEPPVVSGFRT
jgi:hypothetical protein